MLGTIDNSFRELYLDADDVSTHSDKVMLKYVVPEAGYVSIIVCDIDGSEVMRVMNEYRKSGSYRCTVDISSLPIGIYNCIIKAGKNEYSTTLYVLT